MKKVKFEYEVPVWLLAIIYIIAYCAIGAIFGAIVGCLIY